jgi:predicted  nucleic acid-binding Zn-ribbon protein
MSLTKQDLSAIEELFDKKLEKFDQEKILPIRTDIQFMKADMNVLKNDVSNIKSDVAGLRNEIDSVKIDVRHLRHQASGPQMRIH